MEREPRRLGFIKPYTGEYQINGGNDNDEVLLDIFNKAQHANATWLVKRLEMLRRKLGNYTLDGMLVDSGGRNAYGTRPWSSLEMITSGELPPTLEQIKQKMEEGNEVLFPLSLANDSLLIWPEEHEDTVRPIIEDTAKGKLEIFDFSISPETQGINSDKLRVARTKRDEIPDSRFKSGGVAMGKIGFWNNIHHDPNKPVPRIVLRRFPRRTKDTYISKYGDEFVVPTKGSPLSDMLPHANLISTGPITNGNFIPASFSAFSKENNGTPIILKFNTYRPWLRGMSKNGQTQK